MHRRQRVREAMLTVLSNAATAAGSRVYAHRAVMLPQADLPAIRVFTPQEAVMPGQTFLGDRAARIVVRIEAICVDDEDVEVAVDNLCEQIEAAILAAPDLAGACVWCQWQSTDVDFEDEAKTVMVATLDYEAVVSS